MTTASSEIRPMGSRSGWRHGLLGPPVWLALACLACGSPVAVPDTGHDDTGATSTITLNGERLRVHWSDGDSFRILEGENADRGVRLGGYNALESYGPVHRWGEWTAEELYAVSGQATELARSGSWTCTTAGETDHYNRLLVTCDDLTLAMVTAGLGHLFAIDSPASPEQVAAQAAAQEQGLGMWAKGVPEGLVTSLHSADEGSDTPYDRVISTADGSSSQVEHSETYATCQEVCLAGSCLIYVPYEHRYGSERASCLRRDAPPEE